MRKVLIIYKFLPQYRVDFYQKLRNQLLKNNIELSLIYGKENKVNALKNDEVDIEWGKYVPNKRMHIGNFEILWQPCLRFLNDKDLIITQQENRLLLNYYLILARNFSKYKFAYWGHVRNMQSNPNSIGNKFKFLFLHKCDWWFGYTKSAGKYLVDNKYPKNKITIVQNAIDTLSLQKYYADISEKEIMELKNKLGIESNNVGIFCGGMYPKKDFNFILKACFLIKKEIKDFHMLFIGSGIESINIAEASKTNNWIHYMGSKFGRDRVSYFKISTIQLMPRLVGLCILDSFAMETPIITTDHPFHGPEIDYLENGVNGIMTVDNLEIYSTTIIDILLTKKYLKLIEGGKKAAEYYTVEKMAENFKDGIISCLDNYKSTEKFRLSSV